MRFIIDKAEKKDLYEIDSIYTAARSFMSDNGNEGQWDKGYPAISDIEEAIDNGVQYVCRLEGDQRIAAVFVFFIDREKDYETIEGRGWLNDLPYGAMHRVAVADFARGKGAPTACADYCLLACGNLKIDTHEKNIPMRSFLSKNGFTFCGMITLGRNGTKRLAFQKTAKLILASKSPRRIELIQKLQVPVLVEPAVGEEIVPDHIPVRDTAEYLAGIKADEILARHSEEDCVVIGSDTVVICEDEIFGKPLDRADAIRMLKKLSGKTHEVHTGVAIRCRDKKLSFASVAKVSFYEMTDEEIEAYIESGEPMDKAGAYGIQGLGALYIEKIEGDFYTVMGLPIAELYHRLKKEGIEI